MYVALLSLLAGGCYAWWDFKQDNHLVGVVTNTMMKAACQ